MTLGIRYPGGGFYVNDDNDSPYTVRGRADKDAVVNLIATQNSTQTPLGSAIADVNRDWSKAVDFSQFSEGDIVLSVESGGVRPPDVTATYDTSDPTSQATSATDSGGFVTIPWWADDTTSGLGWTELWCKGPVSGTWASTGLSQGGDTGTFYYIPDEGDGTYYFATRSVDKAGNWQSEPNGGGDISTQFIAPVMAPTGKDGGGGGCFIDALLPPSYY
jgi:hypothetical protein